MSKKGLQFGLWVDLWVARFVITCLIASMCAYVCFGDYVITKPQPLARGLTEEQLNAVIAKAPTNSTITLPANLLATKKADITANIILGELKKIIADTRTNIKECEKLSDIEIATLYIKQMQKKTTDINATTNSIEYIIGAGMREDIQAAEAAAAAEKEQ